MAIEYSPSIVTSDLAFYYDMGNTQKSFRGPPTTNLTPNMSLQAVQGAPTVSFVGVEDGWNKYSLNGTWTSGTYPYSMAVQAVTFTGGVTYSTGAFIKTTVPQKFASLFSGMNYVNEPMNNVGTSFSITQPDGSIYVGRSGFQYTNTTTQVGYLLSQPIIGQTFNGATDFVFIRRGQIEIGSFPTPFVAGTRSNTQALVDLTGNNTITASSLTYASDNTFSFNGGNFITIPNTQLGNGNVQWTVNAWVRTTTTTNDLGNGSVMSNSSGGPVYSMMGVNSGRIVYWTYQGAWSQKLSTGRIVNDNVWHMLTWVNYANNTMDMYVDGVQDFFVANSTSGNNNPVDRIGGSWSAQFVGSIATVSRYTRALTAAEVNKNFNATRGRFGV